MGCCSKLNKLQRQNLKISHFPKKIDDLGKSQLELRVKNQGKKSNSMLFFDVLVEIRVFVEQKCIEHRKMTKKTRHNNLS
jgi:hypothetical protein